MNKTIRVITIAFATHVAVSVNAQKPIPKLTERKSKATYFLQWHSWTNAKVGIIDNLNYREMMNDPAAITLDELQ